MQKRLSITEMKTYTWQMKSPPDTVDEVHDLISSLWTDAPFVAVKDRFSFETALVELSSNVIRHADTGSGVSYSITVQISNSGIEATVIDTGEHAKVDLTESNMPDALAESGRGIPLIKALVDHFSYDREGDLNKWQIARSFTT